MGKGRHSKTAALNSSVTKLGEIVNWERGFKLLGKCRYNDPMKIEQLMFYQKAFQSHSSFLKWLIILTPPSHPRAIIAYFCNLKRRGL